MDDASKNKLQDAVAKVQAGVTAVKNGVAAVATTKKMAQGHEDKSKGHADKAKGHADRAKKYADKGNGHAKRAKKFMSRAQKAAKQAKKAAKEANTALKKAQALANKKASTGNCAPNCPRHGACTTGCLDKWDPIIRLEHLQNMRRDYGPFTQKGLLSNLQLRSSCGCTKSTAFACPCHAKSNLKTNASVKNKYMMLNGNTVAKGSNVILYSDKIKIKHAGGGVGNSGAKNGGAGGGVEYTSPKTKGSKGKKLRSRKHVEETQFL